MNIAEILKDCPKGTKLYSPLFGECELVHVDCTNTTFYPIIIRVKDGEWSFTKDGLFYREHTNGECILFPSKDNRDWSTFKIPNKEYEFKPFDKVLVRDSDYEKWYINLYQSIEPNSSYFVCLYSIYKQCIPYEGNEHLLGTTNNLD